MHINLCCSNILRPFLATIHVTHENLQLISLESDYEYACVSCFKSSLTPLMDYMCTKNMNIMTTLAWTKILVHIILNI
jgi:hypothetical protein